MIPTPRQRTLAAILLAAIAAWLPSGLAAAEPVVTNVIASQRPDTKLVDISYDLAYTGDERVEISVIISDDGGQTFEVPAETLTGAVSRASGIEPGTNLQITWNAGVDFNQRFTNKAMVRLQATEWTPPVTGNDPNMITVQGGTLATDNGLDGTQVATFQIGKYEVTWGEWKAVRAVAAADGRDYDIGSVGAGCADDHPVRSVNWYDVVKWCNLKSQIEGLEPVYYLNGQVYTKTEATPTVDASANGYRLPAEAEWEFAARGGIHSTPTTYSGSNTIRDVAWFWDNAAGEDGAVAACPLSSGRGTWPVGEKAENELGLHDMSGNVWEWCWDVNGSGRRLRGGSWGSSADGCTVSVRGSDYPDYRGSNYGFRLARSSGD